MSRVAKASGAAVLALSLAIGWRLPGSAAPGDASVGRAGPRAMGHCAPPRRIVSAALLADELLAELVPLERLTAVSYVVDWASSSPLAGKVPPEIHRTSGKAEDILSVEPDLVIVSDFNSGATLSQLVSAGVCVVKVPSARTLEELFGALALLGEVTGIGADRRIAELRAEVKRLQARKRAAPLRALVATGSFTYGAGTLQHDCLERAGFVNAVAEAGMTGTPAIDVERILTLDPEVVFFSSDTPVPRAARPERLRPGVPWSLVRAGRTGRLFEVPSAWVGSMSHHVLRACHAYAELVP